MDDDSAAEAGGTVTSEELDGLLDDGTPTRVVVLRQPGSRSASTSFGSRSTTSRDGSKP